MADDDRASVAEVAKFAALAPRWWDAAGPMRELHRMNPVRTAWIAGHIRARLGHGALPVLDVGCGGGIATESLARAGLAMTGVDAAAEAIGVARAHAGQASLQIDYRLGTAETMLRQDRRFAAVTGCALCAATLGSSATATAPCRRRCGRRAPRTRAAAGRRRSG